MLRGLTVVVGLVCFAVCGLCARGGVVVFNDGSFSYQGYLEVDGEPANGMYSFRFEAFNEPTGFDIASEFFFTSLPVPVVDGLFVVNVQMGGSLANAQQFWETVGNQDMYLEIGVGMFEGGPYETLGTRVPLGWGARAQYSGYSEALIFPYTDSFTDEFFDPTTMMSLTSVAGGTVLELRSMNNTDEPMLSVLGETVFGQDFGIQNGAVRVDSVDEPVGVLVSSGQYAVVALLETGAPFPQSAVLAQVNNDVNAVALTALNQETGTIASLGTPGYAADFGGDVLARNRVHVRGDAVRDYATNSPSPIGPLAYASVSSGGTVTTGTANVSAVWDAGLMRYEISVADESIAFSTHTVTVSVVDLNEPRLATFNTVGGNVVVKIWDLNSGNVEVQDNFSIVIHDAQADVLARVAVPEGVDPDKYSEMTGAALVETRNRVEPVEALEVRGFGDRE